LTKCSPQRFFKITKYDFDTFDRLYKKAHKLALEIQGNVEEELGLTLADISEFVPSSGAIWLRWAKGKDSSERVHTRKALLGVTFTPCDIRMGLDFGSNAHQPKRKYYELLLERKLEEEIRALYELDRQYFRSKTASVTVSSASRLKKPPTSRTRPGYCFYDTFWHYHIRNLREVSWYGESSTGWMLSRTGMIRDVEEALFPYFLPYHEPCPLLAWVIEKALKELQQQGEKPMTGHKLLVGRVIKRGSEEFPKMLGNISNEIVNTFRELSPILARIEGNGEYSKR